MSRVLSIQSHVVSGYVGNKAAVFPLQLLGFEVDIVNSVQFSNSTGYENGTTGEVMTGDQLRALLDGLDRNGLLDDVGNLLTGYIGSLSFLEAILDVLETLRRKRGTIRYLCDPVLGDNGKFYVPKELVPVYRERVIPMADIVTPNQFEVEQLTGISVGSMEGVRRACSALHSMGPSIVVITSIILDDLDSSDVEPKPNAGPDSDKTIAIIASRRLQSDQTMENHNHQLYRVDCPLIPGSYTGTGDLTSSLLLAHIAKEPDNLPGALEKVINTMHAIIERTRQARPKGATSSMMANELKLIQSKHDIEFPPTRFQVRRL